MKKSIFFLLFLLKLFCLSSEKIIVFESPDAPCCKEIKKNFFPYISNKYKIQFEFYDIGLPENYTIYEQKLKELNLSVSLPEKLPVVFYKNNLLIGENEIKTKLIHLIEQRRNYVSKKLSKIYLPTLILAGLLDGINPCVFAVIIFFVVYLSCINKISHSLKIASFYIPGVFLTYFILGLLFLNIFYSIN
ncbi:MAG: hypothetical protein ACPLZ9_06545 [Candidatus Ratteibacteria bacterium]